MECERIEELLSEYIDDLLDLQTKNYVEDHLQGCEECSKTLEELKTIVQELGQMETVPAPVDFTTNVHKSLAKGTWAKQLFEALFFPLKVKLPLQVAAASIIAILVITFSYKIKPDVEVASRAPEISEKEMKPEPFINSSIPKPEKQDSARKPVLKKGQAIKQQDSKLIELALVLKEDTWEFMREEKRKGIAMEEAQTDESPAKQSPPPTASLNRKELKSSIQKKETIIQPQPKRKALKDQDLKNTLAEIQTLTTRLGGRVVEITYSKELINKPQTITVQLPSSVYSNFLDELKRTGTLQPHVETPTQENILLTVRIHLFLNFPCPELH